MLMQHSNHRYCVATVTNFVNAVTSSMCENTEHYQVMVWKVLQYEDFSTIKANWDILIYINVWFDFLVTVLQRLQISVKVVVWKAMQCEDLSAIKKNSGTFCRKTIKK